MHPGSYHDFIDCEPVRYILLKRIYYLPQKKEEMKMKKFWIMATLLLVLPALMFTVSCAKKVVKKEPAMTEMKKEADDTAKAGMSEAELQAQAEQARLAALNRFENEHIYFAFDSSALGTTAQMVLKQKADWLQENQDAGILVEGHCDERGTVEYNLALGDRRANSAKDFLITLGIDAGRISTITFGEEKPLDPRANEEAWAKNRRAQFVVK